MQNAVAFANNDVITIAWSVGKKPVGCMGFAIFRIDQNRKETALPSAAVFEGMTKKKGQTTKEFPLQKFYWKDVYARLEAETTGNRKFRYKIVPLEGRPGELKAMSSLPFMITNEVEITSKISDNISAYFNRGLISTQHVSEALKGKPSQKALMPMISDEKSQLRSDLSGDMVEALTDFVDRAKAGGSIYAGLYELHDEQLISLLEGLGKKLFIVLSNSRKVVPDKSKPKQPGKDGKMEYPDMTIDDNEDARERIRKTAKEIYDRMMPENHIGHNKFLVYADAAGEPSAVLLGSTNWTSTGLCTQTNNSLVITDNGLAKRYLQYWYQLKDDTKAAGADNDKLQSGPLRTWDAVAGKLQIAETSGLESWFSPNTPKDRQHSHANPELRPPDMQSVEHCINNAKHSILFLAFYPGAPCISDWAAAALVKNKSLFVRGCVTNVSAAEQFEYVLKGKTPPKKVKGVKTVPVQDIKVIAAEAFSEKIPAGWQKEILNAGFAIIHDKVMVIDPFSEDCVVITGSHNLGHKASYDNDENLVIIKGNKKLAMAYATHVLDVYDHFVARYAYNHKEHGDYYLKDEPEKWLGTYFDDGGNIKTAQLKFWMTAVAG